MRKVPEPIPFQSYSARSKQFDSGTFCFLLLNNSLGAAWRLSQGQPSLSPLVPLLVLLDKDQFARIKPQCSRFFDKALLGLLIHL